MSRALHRLPAVPLRPAGTALQPDSFPRWFLIAGGLLIAFVLTSVALVRITGNGPDQRAAAGVAERHLRFLDRPDGGIAVIDARSGLQVALIEGEQGFVRGALRTLARERKVRGAGAEQPFQLIARKDGGLTLYDPVSRQHVDLTAFGPTNAGNFAQLLQEQRAPLTRSAP
jgi:putative photosynthetic complex assembly protein